MLFLAFGACGKWVVSVPLTPERPIGIVVSGVSNFTFVTLCYFVAVSVTEIDIVLLVFG
jgi:hypothetical protein